MGNALGGHEAAVGDMPGEARLLGPEECLPNRRVDAVGPDHHVRHRARAVGEHDLGALTVVRHPDTSPADLDPVRRHRLGQDSSEVAPVGVEVGRSVGGVDAVAERGLR